MAYQFLSTILGINANFTGNVGVGTTTPSYKLDVNGDTRLQGTLTGVTQYLSTGAAATSHYLEFLSTSSTNSYLNLRRNAGANGTYAYYLNNGTAYFSVDNGSGETRLYAGNGGYYLTFYSNNVEAMRIPSATRNVLIGTTTDAGYKLDVNGTARINSTLSLTSSTYAGTFNFFLAAANTMQASSANIGTWLQVGGGNRVFIIGQEFNSTARGNQFGNTVGGEAISAVNIIAQSSGTTATTGLSLRYTINNTGTYVGTTRGIYYNPTVTSLTGTTHYAIETVVGDVILGSTSGNVGIGTTTLGTATRLTLGGSQTASSAIARGGLVNTTLVAAANNDVLVGLDVTPTFTNGAFTNVSNLALRTAGIVAINSGLGAVGTYALSVSGSSSTLFSIRGFGDANLAATLYLGGYGGSNYISNGTLNILSSQATGNQFIRFTHNNGTNALRILSNSVIELNPSAGNVLIGTTTDAGYKLDVNGTQRIQFGSTEVGLQMTHTNGNTASIVIGNGSSAGTGNVEFWRNGEYVAQYTSSFVLFRYANLRARNNTTLTLTGGIGYGATIGTSIRLAPNTSDGGAYTATSGTQSTVVIGNSSNEIWSPSSGNATYNLFSILPSINTSGTYSGIVRGFYYSPTLTSITGVTHRAIETVTGDIYFGSTSGKVGMGIAPSATDMLSLGGHINLGAHKLYNGAASDSAGLWFNSNVTNISGYSGISFRSSAAGIQSQLVRMTIFQTGNVAIGTTTDAGYKLDVNGTARATSVITDTITTTGSTTLAGYSGSTYTYGPLTVNQSTYTFTFGFFNVLYGNITSGYVPKANTIGMGDSAIYNSGSNNVLIGSTTDNGNKLQVTGNVTVSSNISSSTLGVQNSAEINVNESGNNLLVYADITSGPDNLYSGGQVKANIYTSSVTTPTTINTGTTVSLMNWYPATTQGVMIDYVFYIDGGTYMRSGTFTAVNDNSGNAQYVDNATPDLNGSTSTVTFAAVNNGGTMEFQVTNTSGSPVYMNILTRYIPNIF